MTGRRTKPQSVDAYIAGFPPAVQAVLEKLRATIRRALPKRAEETISYQIPTFRLDRNVIYFAAFKNHVSVYPRVKTAPMALAKQLAPYESGRGTFKFPLDQPLPYALIAKIAKLRVKETTEADS